MYKGIIDPGEGNISLNQTERGFGRQTDRQTPLFSYKAQGSPFRS